MEQMYQNNRELEEAGEDVRGRALVGSAAGEGLLTGGEPAGGNGSRGERGLGEAMQRVMGE